MYLYEVNNEMSDIMGKLVMSLDSVFDLHFYYRAI